MFWVSEVRLVYIWWFKNNLSFYLLAWWGVMIPIRWIEKTYLMGTFLIAECWILSYCVFPNKILGCWGKLFQLWFKAVMFQRLCWCILQKSSWQRFVFSPSCIVINFHGNYVLPFSDRVCVRSLVMVKSLCVAPKQRAYVIFSGLIKTCGASFFSMW